MAESPKPVLPPTSARNDVRHAAADDISTRASHSRNENVLTRSLSLRADTVNEETRSIAGVLATESRCTVYDRAMGELIDEVLRTDGARLPEQIPLLANHSRYSLDDVLGSIRELRAAGDQVECRLFFAEGDPAADRAWNKVRQRHMRDLSVGYRVAAATEIEPGATSTVGGRSYTAGARRLRVATDWEPVEGSSVPIGADRRAKTRSDFANESPPVEDSAMKPELLRYLKSVGLRAEASDDEADAFYEALALDARAAADAICAAGSAAPADSAAGEVQTRAEPQAAAVSAGSAASPLAHEEEIRAAERTRITELRRLAADDIPPVLLQRAIDEGWSVQQASLAFLPALRGGRTESAGGGVAIHTRSREHDCTAEVLGIALAMRSGVTACELTREYPVSQRGLGAARKVVGERKKQLEMLCDLADRYRSLSLVDVCREACRIDGQEIPIDRQELVQRAVSGGALSAIYSTSFQLEFMQGYLDAPDTTMEWCRTEEVPTFQPREIATMGKFGSLTLHARGKTAESLDISDSKETYQVKRFTGKWTVDEMDLLDDRTNALEQTAPMDIGLSAKQLRPNAVYSQILQNPELDSDETAVFDEDHGNLGTAVLGAEGIQNAITAIRNQRIRDRVLDLRPRFLLVPAELAWKSDIVTTSPFRISTDTGDGVKNQLLGAELKLIAEPRLGSGGVVDPVTNERVAGTATNWFLVCRFGEGGAKTVIVGYLRGMGQAPRIRSYILDKGQWGIGFDVSLDIGVKILDSRAMYMSSGEGSGSGQ
jgi:hypothetical protein